MSCPRMLASFFQTVMLFMIAAVFGKMYFDGFGGQGILIVVVYILVVGILQYMVYIDERFENG